MGCARGCAVLVALAATLAAYGLWQVGSRAHWTSDGPGILLVMLAFGFSALLAAASWFTVLFAQGVEVEDHVPSRARFVDFGPADPRRRQAAQESPHTPQQPQSQQPQIDPPPPRPRDADDPGAPPPLNVRNDG
ncbi:MAG: hypothetical protein AB7N76_01900 [Planctomycetota bacterium]